MTNNEETKKQRGGLIAMIAAGAIVIAIGATIGAPKAVSYKDGTYTSELPGTGSDEGKTSVVTLTIANGKITDCSWDIRLEDNTMKSDLSKSGGYVMTPDGPRWDEQAVTLAENVVANNGDSKLVTTEEGKLENADTAGASGVSINVTGFKAGVEDCLEQAKA